MVEERGGNYTVRWGTWEELILGGAVLRHGFHDWDSVALELQTRTLYPYLFTPKVCKAKYEVMQERYSGCSAWVEELRRKRVNELRRDLVKSEESIGSLESKLETLKSEKAFCNYSDQDSSAAESSVKAASRDGLSAGSFTRVAQTNLVLQCRTVATEAAEDSYIKHKVLESSLRLEKFPSMYKLAEIMRREHGVNIRRRRGKRRRKDLNMDGKEGSVGDNYLTFSPDTVTPTLRAMGKVTSECVYTVRSPDANDQNLGTSKQTQPPSLFDTDGPKQCSSKQGMDDFIKIFEFVTQNEHASVFRRRLDCQKRGRYKRIIRRHIDLDTIKSKIDNKCITSTVELLRDLLLLANNALVFYSKNTREYKCASLLRDLSTTILHRHYKATNSKVAAPAAETPKSPRLKPPAKPRSARPFNHKFHKTTDADKCNATIAPIKARIHPIGGNGSPSCAESSASVKKTQGKRGCVRRVDAGIQDETPIKVRKRVKT